MKKIVFLSFYNGIVERGAETFVREVAQRLTRRFRVIVFQGGKKEGFEKYGVVRVSVKFSHKKDTSNSLWRKVYLDYWSRLIFGFSLRSLMKLVNERPEVIIAVNGGWQVVLCKLFTLIWGGKLIVSGQAGIGGDDWWNLKWQPAMFIALSTKAKQWARRINKKVKSVYIPNGVDLNKFRPEVKKIELPIERPIILCAAALVTYKRVDLVIKAVAGLKQGSLLILGTGPWREKIDNLGKKLLGPRRYLRSIASYKEIEKYYATAAVFTLVSKPQEAFANVVVEAMAMNKPVIVNDDEVRREIVGESGFYVNPTDIKKYTEMLEKALVSSLGNKPRRQAAKFSWDKIARQYEKLLR